MRPPRLTIGRLMIIVAVSGCVLGVVSALAKVLATTTIIDGPAIMYDSGSEIVIYELDTPGQIAVPLLGLLMVGSPVGIYLLNRRRDRLNRRRDRRRNARP